MNSLQDHARVNCPLCQAPARFKMRLPHTAVYACRDSLCGLRFASPQLDDEELSGVYRQFYYPGGNGTLPSTYRSTPLNIPKQVFNQMGKCIGNLAGKRLLDYGCGTGTLCRAALACGVLPTGIEQDSNARAIVKELGPIGVYASVEELRRNEPTAKFELVVLWQVIEHLRQPWRDLRDLRRFMNRGSWLVVSTPRADCLRARLERERWLNHVNPTHFYYFTSNSLRLTLTKAGFDGVTAQNFHIRYADHNTFLRLLQSLLVPIGQGGELLFTARAGDALSGDYQDPEPLKAVPTDS